MSNIINTVIVALQGYDGLPRPVPSIETVPGLPSENEVIVAHKGSVFSTSSGWLTTTVHGPLRKKVYNVSRLTNHHTERVR